jgi:hypothetical protein
MRIVWHDGLWEVRDGDAVIKTFTRSDEAWAYKLEREHPARKIWRRAKKVAA